MSSSISGRGGTSASAASTALPAASEAGVLVKRRREEDMEESVKEIVRAWFQKRGSTVDAGMERDSVAATTSSNKASVSTTHAPPQLPPPPGQDFEPEFFLYVDKSDLIGNLLSRTFVTEGMNVRASSTFLFASSMRRSGKTTVIKIMAAIARGQMAKFKGMKIITKNKWPFKENEQFHVIELSFTGVVGNSMTLEQAKEALVEYLFYIMPDDVRKNVSEQIHLYGSVLAKQNLGSVLALWLSVLQIKDMAEFAQMSQEERQKLPPNIIENGREIILLIDEYDAPVTTYLPDHPDMADKIEGNVLKLFYETIKSEGSRFRKVFVTGVSKFSMFSSTNIFTRIMEATPNYSTLYGFTASEILETYGEYILTRFKGHQKFKKFDNDDEKRVVAVMTEMTRYYNGYRVHPEQKESVLNPVSIMAFFDSGELKAYWSETGTTKSVVQMLGIYSLNLFEGFQTTTQNLFKPIVASSYLQEWKQVSFQSGYVTIKGSIYDEDTNDYMLNLEPPNEELRGWLRGDFVGHLQANFIDKPELERYTADLTHLNFDSARKQLEKYLNRSPFKPKNEEECRCLTFCALHITNLCVSIIIQTSFPLEHDLNENGLIPKKAGSAAKIFDAAILFMHNGVYHILAKELRFGGTAQNAVEQLLKKRCMQRAQGYFNQCYGIEVQDNCVFGLGINIRTMRGNNKMRVEFSDPQRLSETRKLTDEEAKKAYEYAKAAVKAV